MKEDKSTRLAEGLYKEIIFSECDLGYWASKRTVERLFQSVYETYKDLEAICFNNKRLSSTVLSWARTEIANLIHDYGSLVRGRNDKKDRKIDVIDRLELALELASL